MNNELIIGLDKTSQGQDALALGRLLSEALALKPLVATAFPVAITQLSTADRKEILREETEPLFASALEELEGLNAETSAVASRSPGEFLSLMADDDEARLIVVGSAHHGALGRVFPGSVGQSLLHGAGCAVAVAPRGYSERESKRLQRLGVALDGSDESRVALKTAIALAGRLHATLRVITVAEPVRLAYVDAYSALSAHELYTHEEERKAEVLRTGLATVPKDLPIQSQLLDGEAGRAIARAGEDLDLMIIGSRGYGPIKRTLLGSASSRVIRESACPVLVLPRAAGEDPLGLAELAERPKRADTAATTAD